MKLLTVTVPCYNSADYMRNCIESLLIGGDRMEIIIINDGSKDATGAIADEYREKYPDIVKVIHQENGGHGEGINRGLANATGIYFKVVDSDDRLSADLPLFLDKLEQCEREGGVDIALTNYFYTHSDGIADQSICYANALPEGRIFGWDDTKKFKLRQLFTLHSSTIRTEHLRASGKTLPKHVFYEDNYMICLAIPYIKRMFYFNSDLYLYTIGREGQSIQHEIMMKRYTHHLLVGELCFKRFNISEIKNKKHRRYIDHELYILFGIATFVSRLNKPKVSYKDLRAMWKTCKEHDRSYTDHFLWRTPLFFVNLPGPIGRLISCICYKVANKIVRFN